MASLSPLSRWVWAEGGTNPDLEQKLDVGGFGYPVWDLTSCDNFSMSLPSSFDYSLPSLALPPLVSASHFRFLSLFLQPSPFLSYSLLPSPLPLETSQNVYFQIV